MGEIEHHIRAELTSDLRERYIRSDTILQDSFESAVRSLVTELVDLHGYIRVFGTRAEERCEEMIQRLCSEEERRYEAALRLRAKGKDGIDLVDELFPIKVEFYLYDPELELVGIPDEIWAVGDRLRPTELKTCPPHPSLREGHAMQVAAYALLLETVLGRNVSSCCVRYVRDSFERRFDYSKEVERRVVALVDTVRDISEREEPPDAKPSAEVCDYCPFQLSCPASLAPKVDNVGGM